MTRPVDVTAEAATTALSFSCVVIAFCMLAPSNADAQDKSAALEEIVVTASKRGYAESLQSVPMSIQALSERMLEQSGAKDFVDFARMAPSLTIAGTETGTPQVSIRGVRTTAVPAQTTQENPLTSIYYDDLPASMANFNPNLDLFDIERIEVLRGPQGTLYGAGAMGGNIRFVTNRPNPDGWEAKFEGTLGSTHKGGEIYDLKALVNIPVVEDKFALRLTGTSHWDDGYVDNLFLDVSDFDRNLRQGARAAALFQPTEDLSITASLIYQDTEFKRGRRTVNSLPGGVPDLDDPSQYLYGNVPFLDELFIYNLTFDLDLGWSNFYSSTSYFERDMTNTGSAQGLMEAIFGLQLDSPNRSLWDNTDLVQEFRLTSAEDRRLNWIVGVFYNRKKMHHEQDFTIENAEDVFGFPTGGFGAPDDDILFYGDTHAKQEQYAVFGEATYKITEAWHFTTGLRWFDWKQDFDLFFAGLFQGGEYFQVGGTTAAELTPKFVLSYHSDQNWMAYTSATKGFRLGGLNEPVPTDLCEADLSEVGLADAPLTFEADSLWSYEIGTKTEWFQRRMTVNMAAFYIDWNDIQTLKTLPNCGFYFTENAGALTSKGAEVELVAMPLPDLVVTLAGTYTDASLTEDVPNLLAVKGDRTPNVPKLAVSAAVEYTRPVTERWNGYARFDLQHVGSRHSEFSRTAGLELPSYEIGNLHVGIEGERWAVAVFAKNLWDERGVFNGGVGSGVTSYSIERPRTVGVTLRARY